MIIDRVYRQHNHIVIVVRGRELHHPAFPLTAPPNAHLLIQLIKQKFAAIASTDPTPPADPLALTFEQLKTALVGTDIGD